MIPERFRLVNVQSGSSYPAFLQGLSQSFLIHQTPPCRVDQESTLTHLHKQHSTAYTFSYDFSIQPISVWLWDCSPRGTVTGSMLCGKTKKKLNENWFWHKENAFQIKRRLNDTNPFVFTEALQVFHKHDYKTWLITAVSQLGWTYSVFWSSCK